MKQEEVDFKKQENIYSSSAIPIAVKQGEMASAPAYSAEAHSRVEHPKNIGFGGTLQIPDIAKSAGPGVAIPRDFAVQSGSEDRDTVRDQKIAAEPDSEKKLCDKMTCCPTYPEGKEKWLHGKEGCCPICYEFTFTWCYNCGS